MEAAAGTCAQSCVERARTAESTHRVVLNGRGAGRHEQMGGWEDKKSPRHVRNTARDGVVAGLVK